MAIKKLDPVGRIEGHLGIEYDDLDLSTGVMAKGTMYRGFENIMKNRQPQEGIQICQRI